ncbi:amidohydrolase family protein [Arthrobacter mobilis]|uniref:Amidohydrolase family protein n=1 Tax=Arthrobacter mobilis TaxID=2724944 RepID=A0A7X6K683_9MICC|nr:amidohydrolase family protein [Arthrobacter mobilis]NKX55314.1 amidohydrolase family protein [Arthrobacter mobilis]
MRSVLHLTGHILTSPAEERAEMWVVDGRITFHDPGRVPDRTLSGWVLPGFVDAHCHVGLDQHGEASAETAERQAAASRDSGVLLIRDAGVPGDNRWVQARADLPRLIRCGRTIAASRRYYRNFAVEVGPGGLVEQVRLQARRGDGWVKLIGDWIDRAAGDLAPAFDGGELADAVAAAHAEGARVTAHCFAEQTLDLMLDAGIDCIEHATGLLDRHLPRFAEQGVAIVPTLVNIARFTEYAAQGEPKFPAYARHMRDLHHRRYETVGKAHEAGIRIIAGTDAGSVVGHGLIAEELLELTKAGLPPAAALDAACWDARRWLGAEGISEGASADVVVFAADPRADITETARPRHLVLRGEVLR